VISYGSDSYKSFPLTSCLTSLDIEVQKSPCKSKVSWSRKQRRAYHRLMSGFLRPGPYRFMTLTSAPGSDFSEINEDFEVLKKRILRRYGKMDYWKIKTNEGNGVLHIVYRGPYIPQRWLSRVWDEIHGGKIVDIRFIWLNRLGPKRFVRYLVGGYLSKQSFVRMSWSWGWVFRGFVGYWRRLVSRLGYHWALVAWRNLLSRPGPILFWRDGSLDSFLLCPFV
jgi:hypothetical protein